MIILTEDYTLFVDKETKYSPGSQEQSAIRMA